MYITVSIVSGVVLIVYLVRVNLGGWFVLEPFISPALFQKYPDAIDEWSLSELMAADTASGGLGQLEDHYKTFIVILFTAGHFWQF